MDTWIFILAALAAAIAAVVYSFLQRGPTQPPNSVAPYVPPPAPGVTNEPSPEAWAAEQDLRWSDEEFEEVVLKAYEGHVFNGFYTKLAGVKHRNEDGTSRTAAVRKCEELDRLDVVWEPKNAFDPNAMAVYSEHGQLGFIQSHLAAEQVRDIRRHNIHHVAFFRHVNRHPETNRIVGAVIYLVAFVGGQGIPAMRLLLAALLIGFVGCQPPATPMVETPQTTPAPATPKVEAPADRWTITAETNALDGAKKISLSAGNLVVRCAPKVEAYITPPLNNLGHRLETDAGYEQQVRYRIDAEPVHRERWSIARSFDALFVPRATLRRFAHGNKLTLEYEPEYVVPETTEIDLSGLDEAERKAGCHL